MPIFESNGKKYNVQDEHIEKFGNKFPDATTIMERDGKKYRVKAKDYNTFLGDALQTGSPKETPGVAAQDSVPQMQTSTPATVVEKTPENVVSVSQLGLPGNAQDVAYTAPLDSVPETQKVENVPVVEQDGVAQPQVEAPTVETEPVNADLSSLYTVKSAKEGMTFESAMNRARNRMKMDKVFDDARGMTESMFNTLNKERDRRKSQVEKDVESYNSARKWALSPYASDSYNEFAYRSAATDLRKADDLGMIEEFAKDAKTSLLNDEDFKAGATEKAEALGLTLEQYVDAVAVPMLQEKMWNEWVAPQEEKTKKNYNGLVAAAENSLLGMLLGSSRTDTEKYLSQVGQEAWRKDASLLGKAASGAGSMFLDLPAFVGLGSLASAPARYAGGQAFKHLTKNEAKKMVARGATEAAAQRYANYAVRNGLKNRVLLNLSTAPLQSGLTFGMFDAGKAALNMSLNGEWDWKELGKSAVGGALMGGALGAAGAVGGGLTHGLTGATKAAAKVAEFGVENAVFTEGGRLIGKLHGQQPENGWLEDYVESGATLLMLKAPNIVKNVSAIKGDKDASEVFAFNKLEREQLGKYGEDLNTVLESLLPKSGRLYEDGLKINEGTFPEEYRRVMSDPDVAITTKAKLMGIVEGKVMPAPRVVDAKIEGNRVMTYDPMGRLVEVKEYATEAKANAEYKKVANAAEIESIAVMEDMYVRIKGYEADDVTVREWLAKNPTVTAEDIANIIAKNSAGEKLTEGEQKILESLRKARREGLNDVRHLNGVLAELDVDPKDVMSGIEKPIDDRTEAENRAVKAYTDVLYQEIKAKVVEPFRRGEARRAEDFDTTVRLIESDRSVDETANDGMVYTTTTPSGEKIIITGGKVVLDKYGYIDVNQSEGLVVMFPDGRKKPMRPGDLREKVEVSNAEEIKAAKREEIVESARAKNEIGEPMTEPTAGASQNGNLVPGAEIEVAFDGEIYKLKVDGRDERGDVVLSGEGASMALPESVVRYAMKQAETLQAESEKVEGENEVQPEVVPVVEGQKDENTEKVVESSPAGETAAFEQNIPVDEKGKKMWEQSTPEYIAEYIRVRKPEDVEAQMSVVSGMIEGLEKQKSKMDAMDAMDIDDKIAFWKKVGELIGGAKDVVDPISQLNAKHSSALTAFNSMLENIRREGNEQKAAIRYEGLENMVAELGKQLPEGYTIGVVDGKYTIVEAQPAETVPVVESAPIEDNTPQSQSDSSLTLVEQPTPQATNEMQEADLENVEKGQKTVEPLEETDSSTLSQTSDQVSEQEKQSTQSIGEQVQAAEAEVNTAPTDAQKEAGNYKKGHVKIGPFNISIEQPKGSVRSGVDKDGKKWEIEMQNTYGYFRGTEGVDGDHIDVFLSNDIDGWDGRQVFVVDQRNADGSFDEHKVMLGFNDINDAEAAYMSNYEDGWQGLGAITGVSIEEFEKWLSSSHRKTKAFAEYKNVKTDEGQSTSAESGVEDIQEPRSVEETLENGGENAVPEWLNKVPDDGRNFFVYVKFAGENKYQAIDLGKGETVDRLVRATMLQKEQLQALVDKLPSVLLEDAEFQIRDAKGNIYYNSGKVAAENEVAKQEDKEVSVATEDELDVYLAEMKAAQERQKAFAQKSPRPSSFVEAYTANDAEVIKRLDKQFNDALQTLAPLDIPAIETTIKGMKDRKSTIKAGSANERKETPAYKAFDHIEKALAKRKKQLEKELTEDDKRRLDIIKRGGRGELKETTQPKQENKPVESEPIKDETPVTSETTEQPETGEVADAGPVNMETLQLNMSEEDFNALLNSGDKAAISEYLAEMDGALRIDENSPFAGQVALREEYSKAVEQYGKENIPAEVMDDLNSRMQPYSDLSRAIFDRKYALQDKLREIEASEAQAKEQAEKEAKAEHKQTAFGGFLAGKSDVGASTAEKALGKRYKFDDGVHTVAEYIEQQLENGTLKIEAREEPKYKGVSRQAWNRMDARQQAAEEKRVKEGGMKTVYSVNSMDLGKTAYDYAKFLLDKKAEQEKAAAKQMVKDAIEQFAKEKAAEQAPIKIEDVGEKIGGARKDIIRQYADKIKLDGKTFSTMFPKPDIDKLVEAGLPKDKVATVKAMYDNAKKEFEIAKKRRGKDKALQASLFYAMYAKNVLTGEEGNFDLAYNGFVFTEWGKEFMKANIALYKAVFNKLSTDYGKVDLRSYFITPLAAGMRENFNLKKLNEENSRMQQRMAEMDGRKVPEYKDGDVINFVGEHYSRPSDQFETLEEAVNTMVERISKEVKVDEAAQYKVESYWKRDAQGRADYTKAYLGIKVRGFGTVDVMEFKNMNEANTWLQNHKEDFQQMAAAKEEQVKAENKKPLPKYIVGNSYDSAKSQYSVFADFGKEGVKILKTFNIPQAEGVAAQAKARSEVYKNDVLPYMNSEEALSLANGFAQEIRDAKSAKQKPVTVEKKSRERVGVDWRNGKNATPDMFVDIEGNKPSVFGFRAVEFGNYVTQKERQQYLNDLYDALMDMSELLGVSPRALSLGGKLALAVGARGTSGASGHYEPYKNVINITKTSGAGVLAHEWLHAFDRYFSNFDENAVYPNGVMYATQGMFADNTRKEVKEAFDKVMAAIKGGDYEKRSMRLGEYWASDKELAARALQGYIIRKLDDRGQKNDFLSNHVAPEEWDGDAKGYPFPLGEDAKRIADAFDNLFATLEEKTTEDGNVVLYSIAEDAMLQDRGTEAFERATKVTMDAVERLKANGLDIEVVSQEEADAMMELAEMQKRTAPETVSVQDEHLQTVVSSAGKRKSPETALPEDESSFKGTAISSDDGAKILKDIDSAIAKYENSNDRAETFIGNVAKALGIDAKDKSSKYATFEAKNGVIFTIRISNHNATVSNFDNAGEGNGISIVISRKPNEGVTNDGNAHLVEFFYPEKKISKADGKPLVEILKSIKQALYSGEYKDNTGLAVREEVNIPEMMTVSHSSGAIENRVEFLRTANGKVYGWAVNGTIYLMPDGINPNTPVHEYAHLWGADVEKNNPKLWNEVVEAMKLSPVWNEVANDANYSNIHGNDSRMASEVLARLSGRENYRRTMEEAQREIEQAKTIEEKAEKISRWAKIKAALKNLWNWVQRNVFRKKENATAKATTEVMPWEEFANSVVGDFYKGKNPNVKESPLEKMAAGEVESKPISRIDLSNGPVRGVNEPEWKFKARREKWRRWVESNTDVKTPMPEKPFLQEGEPIEVYEERMKEFNKALNRWKKDILSKDSEIEEMLNILYDGKVPEKNPTPEDEFTEQVFKRYMGDDGIRVDRKSMRGMIMDEIIERRRKIETNNFDDVVFINEVRKATTAEQRKAIPFIIEGTYNGEVSKELAVVVRRVKDWFENVYQALQAADAMHSSGKIKNYVTHIWDKNRTPKAVYENYINTRSKYTNRRSIDTYAEGIALGMVPKYDDICDIMLEYGHIANEAIANKDFTDFLHMLRVDGEPVLKDVTIRDPMYVRTSSEALDGYKVHKYAKGIVENVLGTVRTENAPEWMQKLAHFYDVSGSLKKKINLSLSFFHHGALLETAVGAMNPAKAVSTVFKNLVWDCMRSGELPALSNPEATRNAVNHLVQLGATQDYMAKEVNRLTGRLKEVLKDFSDKHPNLVTKGVVKPAELLDFLNTGFDKVLWDYLHDGLKIYTFDKYAKEIEEYAKKKGIGDTEKDMLLNEAGQLVNDIYGGQFWELINVSPAAVKWLRRLLLSPDWTISTIRQALSPIGFGTLYKDYKKNWAQRTVGTGLSASFRRKQGVKFWITALLTFGALMNGLNAWRRKEDVDDELEKAEERRKTDPEYKSPYELKYPDGMKWYDYTMYGNTIGHQTHLFGWRYDDEKEGYIRWGKQFRELPELFLGKDGFSFPGPMIDKMVGKANPNLSAGLAFLGYAKDGWQSKWMKDKKGWEKELGRVMMMAASFMPYSIPTDDDKEFVLTDLMMPSSKGFSNNKAIRGFETAILSQDFDYVGAVYDACVMNKLDAEKLLQVAIARVEAQAKAEYVEGANTLNEAWGKYQEDLEINEKRAVRTKLNKLLQENAYKDFAKQEARDMVQSVIDGTYREEKLPEAYIASETAEDVRDAYKMDAIRLRLKKVVDDIPEDAVAYKQYYNDNKAKIDLYDETVAAKREMNLIMEDIKITPQFTEQYMQEIRDIRREIIEMANNLTGNNE